MVVVLDPPVSDQIDGLRRAVGDPSLTRVPPHITLVPPVNVRRDDLPAALEVLRSAAARPPGRLSLALGQVSSFLPHNPVVYLSVGGDLDELGRLRDAVFQPPLERPLSWPWVPHVTVADGLPPARIPGVIEALGPYSAVVACDRLVLLEEGPGRTWSPLADAALGAPARIGTGGLALELVGGRLVDPRFDAPCPPEGPLPPLVINAYREGAPVGWARASLGWAGPIRTVWVAEEHRGQGIGHHLRAHLEWALERESAHGRSGGDPGRSGP